MTGPGYPPRGASSVYDAGRAGWLGVALVGLCAALTGVLEALLVPLYLGSWVFPVAVPIALVSNFALPRMARALVPRTAAAVVPFVVWLVVMIGFGLVARPEGDVILPGGDPLQWVTYGVLFGGAIAAVASIVGASAPAVPAQRDARPSSGQPTAGNRPGR